MKTLDTSMHQAPLMASALFGALALISGALSTAAESDAVPHALVKYGDLDLSNPQGARALYNRIAAAAGEVCKSYTIDSRNLTTQMQVRACVHKAIAEAVIKVGRPELAAIYGAKTGRPVSTLMAVAQTR